MEVIIKRVNLKINLNVIYFESYGKIIILVNAR